jgi:hypothetical protein
MKVKAATGIILLSSIVIAGYLGYLIYHEHKLITQITPSVKYVSIRINDLLKYEVGPSQITFQEIFDKSDLSIREIDNKVSDVQALSTPATSKKIEPVMIYMKSGRNLLRAQSAKYHALLASSRAKDFTEKILKEYETGRSSGNPIFTARDVYEAEQKEKEKEKEYRESSLNFRVALSKFSDSYKPATTIIPTDCLVDMALVRNSMDRQVSE